MEGTAELMESAVTYFKARSVTQKTEDETRVLTNVKEFIAESNKYKLTITKN